MGHMSFLLNSEYKSAKETQIALTQPRKSPTGINLNTTVQIIITVK